jgi:hypothetical protein
MTNKKRAPHWCGTLMSLSEYKFIYCRYVALYYIMYGAPYAQDISNMPFCISWKFLFVLVKSPLGRLSPRWEDNTKMYLPKMVWGGMDSIAMTQVTNSWWAFVNAVMNIRVP